MNDKETRILNLMNSLVIADTKTLAEILNASYALTYKYSNNLADLGKIEKHQGFWRIPGCKSQYGEHPQLLTKSLAQILKKYQAVIYREKTISEVGLRPDALILLKNEDKGLCFVLEVMNKETESYFEQKKHVWENWDGAREYLSRLFGYLIPHFDLVTSDQLSTYLEEGL